MIDKIKRQTNKHKTLIENFSYLSVLEVFVLLTPLITYPYLTRVLGTEIYGLVITAQILASYATIVVKFGFDSVSARHISIWREDTSKLSDIMSSIMTMRGFLWIISFAVYFAIVVAIPIYREHLILFLFSFGLTLNVLLFPQFFFQGIEHMKYITYINIGIQSLIIVLTFVIIKGPEDYLFVPVLYATGYFLGGMAAIYIIINKYKIKYKWPTRQQAGYYLKDALPLFATTAVCTIKDKFSYLLLGVFVNMGDVVIYDVGSKLTSLSVQPLTIINTVIFPRMAKIHDDNQYKKFGLIVFFAVLVLVIIINIFLHSIVFLLIGKEIDLIPLRVFLLSPIFLAVGSYIGSSLIVARGYNKYMFYSILVTTSFYLVVLASLFLINRLDTIMSFVGLTVFSYLVEMLYRLSVARRILK